ncbi:MAG TPA: hypothetical protein VE174_03325 [Actinomycetota bacterium]|nr:hypothetical protein [Actinomycetota bacterium]
MTKRCGRCGRHKSMEEFAWRRKWRNQRDNYCRPCRADYKQEHYAKNRQRYIDNAAKRTQKVVEERTLMLLEYFRNHPCADCGERDPVVLEFDHLGEKNFALSYGIRNHNWQRVLEEIARCDVVCSNCHRRRTARRGGFARTRFSLD